MGWKHVKTEPPAEGTAVLVSSTTTDVAYYCDGEFYYLEYDPNLGVLRKQYVNASLWTEIPKE